MYNHNKVKKGFRHTFFLNSAKISVTNCGSNFFTKNTHIRTILSKGWRYYLGC